ncbi:MAG: YeeE/YedE family protein [Clostridiales bacterium]|nr:YeeE/YedE family protein [Clostridiales bacterium]
MMSFATVSWVSLAIGLIFGFLAQRSRMCFIGGWRDFFLIKDTYLLKGFIAFFVTAALFFLGFWLTNHRDAMVSYPWFARETETFDPRDFLSSFGVLQELDLDDPAIIALMPDDPRIRNLDYCDLVQGRVALNKGQEIIEPGLDIFGLHIPNEMIMMLVAILLMGFCSVMANGCPLRQHTMASSGNASAMFYLLGFYVAIIVYNEYISGLLQPMLQFEVHPWLRELEKLRNQ